MTTSQSNGGGGRRRGRRGRRSGNRNNQQQQQQQSIQTPQSQGQGHEQEQEHLPAEVAVAATQPIVVAASMPVSVAPQPPLPQPAVDGGGRPPRPRPGGGMDSRAPRPARRRQQQRPQVGPMPSEVLKRGLKVQEPTAPLLLRPLQGLVAETDSNFGCSMLHRNQTPLPTAGFQRVGRCSLGWALHNRHDELRCMYTAELLECWQAHPEKLPDLEERIRLDQDQGQQQHGEPDHDDEQAPHAEYPAAD